MYTASVGVVFNLIYYLDTKIYCLFFYLDSPRPGQFGQGSSRSGRGFYIKRITWQTVYLLSLIKSTEEANHKVILSLVDPAPDASLVDLGCGDGKLSARIRDKCGATEILGIDSDENEWTKATEAGVTGCTGTILRNNKITATFPGGKTFVIEERDSNLPPLTEEEEKEQQKLKDEIYDLTDEQTRRMYHKS